MTELGREFDQAQVLDAFGDLEAAHDKASAERYYRRALRVYEGNGHLRAMAATYERINALQ